MTSSTLLRLRQASRALLRAPSGHLCHPFLVPGSIYAAEQWDWDSYWTARGLLSLATLLEDGELHRQVVTHGQGCIRNLFSHQAPNGTLPIMMRADNPDVFGCRREDGPEVNQAKPIVGQFVLLLSDALCPKWQGHPAPDSEISRGIPSLSCSTHEPDSLTASTSWFAPYLDGLRRFYDRWEQHYRSHTGLLVWGSDVAIGVDNDPTTYGRPDFSSANLLLNCLYIEDLRAAATVASRLGEPALSARWTQRADELAHLVASLCWDPRDRFFYTLDVQCGDHRAERIPWARPGMPMNWQSLPIRIQSFTGFLPLWCGAAKPAQARELRRHLLDPETFYSAFGVRSLSRLEPMFSLAESNNPSNWLGPIWIMVNYFVWSGLRRSGFKTEATDLARRTLDLLERDLQDNGALHEYYHPDTGDPLMNKGFLSWNFLACEMLHTEPALLAHFSQQLADQVI